MPPIPITFHTRPTPRRFSGGTNAAKQPLYFSVDSKSGSKATSTHSIPPTPKSAPKTTIAPAQATSSSASGSGSGSSSTSTTPAPSARRKSTIPRPTSTKGYITLTPLNSAILDRCLLSNPPSNPTPTISPRKHSSKTPIPTPVPSHILPYSRLADLANDRSPNPSPREILRAQRAEAEKARNKKDSVAAARAAIAAKKKPKKGGRGKGSNSAPRSPSPSNEVRGLLGLGGSGLRQEVLPTITTEMASPEYTAPTVPLPTSRSLKRTRSAGIPPLSTGVANALGTGNLGIGSPLKAVIGPDGDDGDDAEEAGKHRMKRSRTHEPILPSVKGGPGPSGLGTNRKKSHSPKGTKAAMVDEALPVPKTVPMAAGRLVPGASGVTRQSGRASSVAVGAGLGGLVGGAGVGGGEGMGGTSMRRAVSAAGAGTGGEANRRDSMGSQGSEGMVVSGRSRREVNLPRALRDYETRPGTMV